MKDTVQVDVMTDVPETSDVYLLCSDGLSGMVEDGELRDIIDRNQPDLEKTCAELIQAANRHGGVDNVTAVLIRIVPN
jgi:protein phosphatase